jgi:hypothetical protein
MGREHMVGLLIDNNVSVGQIYISKENVLECIGLPYNRTTVLRDGALYEVRIEAFIRDKYDMVFLIKINEHMRILHYTTESVRNRTIASLKDISTIDLALDIFHSFIEDVFDF